ncbi:MAG: hypothetical protein ACO33E_04485 [Aquiluna sp.]
MVEPVGITEVVSECFLSPSELPPDKLEKRLETAKKYFLTAVERDCRQTTKFLEEWRGKGLYKHFCDDWKEFCMQYFERPAEWLDYVAEGTKLLDPKQPQTPSDAIRAVQLKATTAPDRKRQKSPETLANEARAWELREQGLTQKQIGEELGMTQQNVSLLLNGNTSNTCYNVTSVACINDQLDRPSQRGNSEEYRQARLRRDAPEIAERVESGEITTNQGMKLAGLVKSKSFTLGPKTDLDALAQKLLTHDRQLAMALAEAIIDQTQETL